MAAAAENRLIDANGLLVTFARGAQVLLLLLHGREIRPVRRIFRMIGTDLLLVELHCLCQRARRGPELAELFECATLHIQQAAGVRVFVVDTTLLEDRQAALGCLQCALEAVSYTHLRAHETPEHL